VAARSGSALDDTLAQGVPGHLRRPRGARVNGGSRFAIVRRFP
jgi:hypothetical protein